MPEKRSPLKVFRQLEEKLRTVGLSPEEQARYEELKAIVSPEASGPAGGAAAPTPADSLEPAGPGQPEAPAGEPGGFDLASLALEDVDAAFDAAMAPVGREQSGAEAAGAVDGDASGAGAPEAAGDAAEPEGDLGFLNVGAGSFGVAPAPDDGGAPASDGPGLAPAPEGTGRGSGAGAPGWDLGPAAFDAAGLPPEPAANDRPWEVTGSARELELADAELVEAEPAEPAARAPAAAERLEPEPRDQGPFTERASDLFGTSFPEPEAEGDQPLDASGFGGAEAAPGHDADAAADPLPSLELDSPPADPPRASAPGDLEDLDVEEMPPVDVDLGEMVEPPRVPAMESELSPTFVPGEHRVLVQTMEGGVLRGSLTDVDLSAPSLPLVASAGAVPDPVDQSRVKAIFFMLLPGGRPPTPEGRKVRVVFRDGKQVAGFSTDDESEAVGFFLVPAESRTGTGRIWVYRRAVQRVSVS